jgi:hypothetical protein
MRIIIESGEDVSVSRPAAGPAVASTNYISAGAASAAATSPMDQTTGFGRPYAAAPASIANDALSRNAIDGGSPPRELIDRADRIAAGSSVSAESIDDQSTRDGGAAPSS